MFTGLTLSCIIWFRSISVSFFKPLFLFDLIISSNPESACLSPALRVWYFYIFKPPSSEKFFGVSLPIECCICSLDFWYDESCIYDFISSASKGKSWLSWIFDFRNFGDGAWRAGCAFACCTVVMSQTDYDGEITEWDVPVIYGSTRESGPCYSFMTFCTLLLVFSMDF